MAYYTTNRMFCIILLLIISISVIDKNALAEETIGQNVKIGIIPFFPLNLEDDDAEMFARALGTKLKKMAVIIEHDEMMDVLDEVDCDDEEDWNKRQCIQAAGEELGSDFIVAGSIGKVGAIITAEITLHDINKRIPIWSREYTIEGSIEDFIINVPNKVANELPVENFDNTGEISTIELDTRLIKKVPKSDIGIVKGATIGVNCLFALEEVKKSQSPGSFKLMFLYPTSDKSHVRVKAGIPLWHNDKYYKTRSKDKLDPYFSIEHEWGFKKFGVTAGLAYILLQEYSYRFTHISYGSYYYDDTTNNIYQYDVYNAFNVVFGIRGGHPNRAFFGKISFPLAVAFDESRKNYFLEYSLFGVFGAKNTKVGIGNMGMFKYREKDKHKVIIEENGSSITVDADEYYDYYDDEDYGRSKPSEFYSLFPCIKIARLFGDRFVASITLEVGGLIIPRFGDMRWWQPSIGFDFIYSFSKLEGPNIMDGSF